MSTSDREDPPSTSSIFANAAKARRHVSKDAKPGKFTLVCAGCGAPRMKDDSLECTFCGSTLTPKTAP